METALRISEQ